MNHNKRMQSDRHASSVSDRLGSTAAAHRYNLRVCFLLCRQTITSDLESEGQISI